MSFSARASSGRRAWSLRPCFTARTMLTWSFHLSQPQFTFSKPNRFIIDSDFFGAHTFRIQKGKGSEKLPEGQDVHVNWTGRGGNISASTYNA